MLRCPVTQPIGVEGSELGWVATVAVATVALGSAKGGCGPGPDGFAADPAQKRPERRRIDRGRAGRVLPASGPSPTADNSPTRGPSRIRRSGRRRPPEPRRPRPPTTGTATIGGAGTALTGCGGRRNLIGCTATGFGVALRAGAGPGALAEAAGAGVLCGASLLAGLPVVAATAAGPRLNPDRGRRPGCRTSRSVGSGDRAPVRGFRTPGAAGVPTSWRVRPRSGCRGSGVGGLGVGRIRSLGPRAGRPVGGVRPGDPGAGGHRGAGIPSATARAPTRPTSQRRDWQNSFDTPPHWLTCRRPLLANPRRTHRHQGTSYSQRLHISRRST